MLRIPVWLLVGLLTCSLTSCSIICPDGQECPNHSTCCMGEQGYSCCLYPRAVCCSDRAHCCPSGFRCNMAAGLCEKEDQPWMSMPMVEKEAPRGIQEQQRSSVVHCDNHWACPDGTTCCRHPQGGWSCCPLSPARCCLDGYHCCPYGSDCDHTYTKCVPDRLTYPFTAEKPATSRPAFRISTSQEEGVGWEVEEKPLAALTEAGDGTNGLGIIRCDSKHYCPGGCTCCKGATGQWTCCPYPLGQCCSDGRHCCQYGYTCDPSSGSCRGFFSQMPSGTQ